MDHQTRYERYMALIEEGLEQYLPNTQIAQAKLLDAMIYSLSAAGKRVRPVLTLAFCGALGGSIEAALPFACALEMIHTYALIHDDLPCMDDDDTRRGIPANHRMFGEASALLAGDALLSAAFETVLDMDYVRDTPPERVISAAHRMALASGLYGLAGGQLLGFECEAFEPNIDTAAQICLLKTAALIEAAAAIGCELAGGGREHLAAAASFARCMGLIFQIKEDLRALEDSPEKTDQAAGTDIWRGKLTFGSLFGAAECRRLVGALADCAEVYLEPFPEKDFLVWLARVLIDREG